MVIFKKLNNLRKKLKDEIIKKKTKKIIKSKINYVKNGAHVVNLDEYKSIETYWMALHMNDNNNVILCFNSFGVYIYRIQAYHSIMHGYFCIGFIDFMSKGKGFLDYTNLFSPNDDEKNGKTL